MGTKETKIIGEKTGLSLGLFIGALTLAVGGTSFIVSEQMRSEAKLDSLSRVLNQLRRECVSQERFTIWQEDLKDANPTLKVPRLQSVIEKGGSMVPEPSPRSP